MKQKDSLSCFYMLKSITHSISELCALYESPHIIKILFVFYFFVCSGSGSSKVDEAMDLYQQAANKFKMAKKWGSAGHAFTELASLHAKAGSRLDAATNYVEAGNCYKKTDPNGRCLSECC